jgi:hypothetical protein
MKAKVEKREALHGSVFLAGHLTSSLLRLAATSRQLKNYNLVFNTLINRI